MIRTRFLLRTVVSATAITNSFINFAVLQTYKSIKGNLKISSDYVVGETPEDAKQWPAHYIGFKLGSYATFLSTGLKNGSYSSSVVDSLKNMGFDSINAYVRNNEVLLSAASTYIRLYGSGVVPSNFKIPLNSPEWPSETLGMSFGHVLSTMRSDNTYRALAKQPLIDLGISFDSRQARNDIDVCLEATKVYKSIHGTVDFKRNFVVPDDERYAPEARGIRLGVWLYAFRHSHDKWPEHKEQLQNLGVDFSIKRVQRFTFEEIYSALSTYYTTHGHLQIPRKYVVPFQDQMYDEELWGLGLGRSLAYIKTGGFSQHREQLSALGLVDTAEGVQHRRLPFQLLYDALVVFKMIHGHLRVVNSYVIPLDDERYPEGVRGAKLGVTVRNIRLMEIHPQHREALSGLGLEMGKRKKNSSEMFDTVYDCLVAYKQINGQVNVPFSFQVPENDERYPVGTGKFYLGRSVANIRKKGSYSEHREKLLALGFRFEELDDKESQYMDRVVAALEVYKRLHGGSVNVPYRYVVATDDPEYPEETRGLRLGSIVSRFRAGSLNNSHGNRLTQMGIEIKQK